MASILEYLSPIKDKRRKQGLLSYDADGYDGRMCGLSECGVLLQESRGAFEQLKYLTQRSIGWLKSNMQYWRLLISLSFQTKTIQPLLPKIHEIEMEMMTQSANIFRRIGVTNPESEAMFYGATMDGIAIQYVQVGEKYPIDKMVEKMVLARYKTV